MKMYSIHISRRLVVFSVVVLILISQLLFRVYRRQKPDHPVHDKRWHSKEPGQHVILLAYMRSGSSFVGNVLQHSPDVFYIFEPFFKLEQMYTEMNPITFLYKPPFFARDRNVDIVQNEYLTNLLSCKFTSVDVETLTQVHWHRGRNWCYYQCIDDGNTTPISNILKCLHILYNECNTRPVSLAKVIRYRMKTVHKLLDDDHKLKVIHLVRDPRAILSSRHRIGNIKLNVEAVNESNNLCGDIYNDIQINTQLNSKYKNRIKLIRYEDLVENPIEEFQNLYKFINISFGKKQVDYIHQLTNQSGSACTFCVTSKKSSETAHAWRFNMDFNNAKVIDKNCAKVYEFLGYENIEKKEYLTDRNFQLYKNKSETLIFNDSNYAEL